MEPLRSHDERQLLYALPPTGDINQAKLSDATWHVTLDAAIIGAISIPLCLRLEIAPSGKVLANP